MKAKTGLDASLDRAKHLITLYDLLCDQRQRGARSDWSKKFKNFMRWPQEEKIVRVDGEGAMLIIKESAHISRSHFSHDYLSEILRSAVVASISALDRYFHDLIVEKCWKLLSKPEKDVPPKLGQLGLPALETAKALTRLRQSPNARPGNTVKKAIQKVLHEKHTFQGVQSLSVGAKLLGITQFWPKVAAKFIGQPQPKEVQEKLTLICRRRNQIVHEADLVLKSKGAKLELRGLERDVAADWVDWIDQLTNAIQDVVDDEL